MEKDETTPGRALGRAGLEPQTLRLMTTGRVTGRPHGAIVRFAYAEGAYFVMGESRKSDWVLNALARGSAEVNVGDSVQTVVCEEFGDDGYVRRLFASKYGEKVVQEWYEVAGLRSLKLTPRGPAPDRAAFTRSTKG